MITNIFITGKPKSGKSTMLESVISGLSQKVGLLTREIKEGNERVGFQVESHSGNRMNFAHVDYVAAPKVGKYGVNRQSLETILHDLSKFSGSDILYIDEVGQMQLSSKTFRDTVSKFADSQNIFLATLSSVYEDELIQNLKNRKDAIIVDLSDPDTKRQEIFIKAMIHKIGKARKYATESHRFNFDASGVVMQSEHAFRRLTPGQNGLWKCDCPFYEEHSICSHSMAVGEIKNHEVL